MQENCREYWNGSKLVPLEQKDRQALMDYYNKTSAVMPCYAVAYRPIYTASSALQKAPIAVYVQLQDRRQSTASSRARSSSAAARDRSGEIKWQSRNVPAMADAPKVLSRETSGQSVKSATAFGRGAFHPDKFVRRKSVSAGYHDLLDKQIFLGIIGVQVSTVTSPGLVVFMPIFTRCMLVWLCGVASTTSWNPGPAPGRCSTLD